MIQQRIPVWAKLKRDEGGAVVQWHSLEDHSIDVASVLQALVEVPTIRERLSRLAGRALDSTTTARLAALAFLHDAGKANRGFQARWVAGERGAGHIAEFAWLCRNSDAGDLHDSALSALGAELWETWFSDASWPLFDAVYAHHGRPWPAEICANYQNLWRPGGGDDPIATLGSLGRRMRDWFGPAFSDGSTLPEAPAFHHAFAGLLMLADWLGSDTTFFPYSNGGPEDRWAFAQAKAREALRAVGLDVSQLRYASSTSKPDFEQTFGFAARPLQAKVTLPDALCVVLEAETGSGKTEAALWRFWHLFQAGKVDGLYFALPTRVAASQAFIRIRRFAEAVFGPERPAVVLAVPGQVMADDARGYKLPDFGFAWDDDPDDATRQARWSATHPKRFLAAQISVGTIDQALLGAIRTRHAHMRAASLMRHLLVVDEVHASDHYMGKLLETLLQTHLRAGGHALLLSATLGSTRRAALLGTSRPNLEGAIAAEYPALHWATEHAHKCLPIGHADGAIKRVTMEASPAQNRPHEIAAMTLAAAVGGGKILIIRNTVADAIAVQQALEAVAPPNLLFQVAGQSAPHHSRFAPEDRVILDAAVERSFGKTRIEAGLVLVGTQTLEISLDLDADLLITDICPADVLLQRIGRLHRHARMRPAGLELPRAVVLVPEGRDLLQAGRRGRHGLGTVYPDLLVIEATWRLLESEPIWTIPTMNRLLVEHATHSECLAKIETAFLVADKGWRNRLNEVEGKWRSEVQAAVLARLNTSEPFDALQIDADEMVTTRLGASDLLIDFPPQLGAFGTKVAQLKIPGQIAPLNEAVKVEQITTFEGGFQFILGESRYRYDRLGLRKV